MGARWHIEEMHMRINIVLWTVVLAASITVAGAEEFKPPPQKDGLWEAHSVRTAAGKTASDTSVKMCQSKQLTQQSEAFSKELRQKNQCTSVITQHTGDTVVEESRCAKGPNAGSVTKVIYSHISDTASHMEMHTQIGGAESVTVMDMKYLGSCPVGMKPGDIIMPDGKKISSN
jgi:hypothetical protein